MYLKPKELERPHLEEVLSEIQHKPLVLVTAPAGYGKTTAVKAFLKKHNEIKAVWFSLGRAGEDEAWVWQKLCETVSEIDPAMAAVLRELGIPQTDRARDTFIHMIRNSFEVTTCLVLDDYQEYGREIINKLIERLTYEEIANFHILLITRTYPDIPYEELFLKGYCIALDQQTMALSREEEAEVFRINQVALTKEEAEKMHEYTDGWIAAVYLALYDHKRMGRFEHLTNIGRLLKTAIFDKLSPGMQELCMKMSIFSSFTLEEASYVLNREISHLAISQMQEQFGFIQYELVSGRYTMHTLLKSVAENELDKAGIDRARLYVQCGRFREKNGGEISALICYGQACAYEEVLRLLSGDARNTIFEQAPGIVSNLFEEISLELKMRYPKASLGYIYYVILKEDAVRGRILFEEIRAGYEESGVDAKETLRGELLVIEALLEFNHLEKTNVKLKQAYQLLGNQASDIFEYSLLTFGTPIMTVLYYDRPGSLKRTIELEKEYAVYHTRLVKGLDEGWDDFLEAEYALMTGDTDRAELLSRRVVEKTAFGGGICILISGYYILARCLMHKGREREFNEVMEEFRKRMEGTVRPVLVTDYELAYSYLYACMSRYDRIPEWLRSFNLENCSRMVRNIRCGGVAYGTILCRQKKWIQLDALAEQIMVPYETTNHIYIMIFGYIFKTIATLRLTGMEKALEYFMKAVELAQQDGVTAPFIERGEELEPVVEAYGRNNRFCAELRPRIREYLLSFRVFEKEAERVILTGKEKELMGYVKAGLRNMEISDRMNVALVTVEKNLTNIYRKLNVSNRASAIARIEDLHIL